MRTLITGAGGFVGAKLLERLAATLGPGDEILAADLAYADTRVAHKDIEYLTGSLTDAGTIARLTERPLDRVFHLATVAGVGSAADFAGGKRMNLDATLALIEAIRESGAVPRFVYSSSVGVYGRPLPAAVDDSTSASPSNSYGTHKLIGELLVNDYTRAGYLDGIALRFPGVVARPPGSATMLSAFLNDIFYAARDKAPFALPLAPEDATWLMSIRLVVDNLEHAAGLAPSALPARRNWNLPASLIRMDALVDALARAFGSEVRSLIRYRPDDRVRAMFSQVPMSAAGAEALGFTGDGDAEALVANVIADTPGLRA
ncbi:MAG TPA: NAD-dependent epimerase/dehydratase family protein [Allosphingosinicella sp.]|nr:NAD-dependent epimerase/dehydratase family protein [Allosphingosinicella sp.]